MSLKKQIARVLLPLVWPKPVEARHTEYSMLFSSDDDLSQPSPYLISLAIQAITRAQSVSVEALTVRPQCRPYNPQIWPGEHYKLLAGVIHTLAPRLLIEIGTGNGTSALAMKPFLPKDGRLVTFDVLDWRAENGALREDDFRDGRLVHHQEDLTQPQVFERHRPLFEDAQMIFVDAAKDGVMEQTFLDAFETVRFKTKPLVVFDDIRLWNMLKIWRTIRYPKLDLTSFGHYTGTGLVDWDRSARHP